MNGKSIALPYWDHLLASGKNVHGISSDDAHISEAHPHFNGGWIKVSAGGLSPERIMESIRKGAFFASTGPDFLDISWDGTTLSLKTTPCTFIRLAGGNGFARFEFAENGETITEASFDLSAIDDPKRKKLLRLEIESSSHLRAWSNTLFI